MEESQSIVEYFAEHEGYRCGYCKATDTNFSHGMWAHQMHVQDYQDLIDRGWRRSGKYVYKPTMNRTCCPMYTIKCDANEFKLSKSQKKVLKRVNRFLITGKHDGGEEMTSQREDHGSVDGGMSAEGDVKNAESMMADKVIPSPVQLPTVAKEKKTSPSDDSVPKDTQPPLPVTENQTASVTASSSCEKSSKIHSPKLPKPGSGADPNKPVCRKAKELRAERRLQKLAANPDKGSKQTAAPKNAPKSLEDMLSEPDHQPNCAHKLELRLVRSSPRSPEFESTFSDTHRLYHSYQTSIHNDPPSKPSERQFTRFLCDSPLGELQGQGRPRMGYGSFHQQYLLDGKLIAVGVIDILPTSVSSVYLYYHPDYCFLSLGVYSAIRELAFVRELARHTPALHYYYMGFYIHSCSKMRYKGQYFPSFLACPETYNWIPLEECRPKLERSKYSRLDKEGAEDKDKVGEDTRQVLVLYKRQAMPYAIYKMATKGKKDDQDEVKEYASFVGKTCAERMLLVRT